MVYHPASGDVHLLTDSAHLLWQLVSDGRPHALADLVASLAAHIGRAPDDELAAVTRDTLAFMDRTGLVEPVAP